MDEAREYTGVEETAMQVLANFDPETGDAA
jgi:hypothetical protein